MSFTGCGSKDATETASEALDSVDAKLSVPAVTQEQATQLVEQINAAVADNDAAALAKLIDVDKFYDRVFQDLPISDAARKGFISGVEQGGGIQMIMKQIVEQSQVGSYRLVRYVEKEGGFRPLYRLSVLDGGHNYHEIVPVEVNGQIRIADIHVMLTGELLSKTLRRSAVQVVAYENRSFVDRLTGAEAEFLKHGKEMQQMAELGKAGDRAGFMALYDKLPDSLQKDRNVLMLRMMVSQSEPTEYTKALVLMEETFPDDPSNDFRAIDRLAMQGDHEGALAAVDRLIVSTKDPFLNSLRANALVSLERFDDASAAAQSAIEAEPDNIDGHWVALGVALKADDFPRVSELLKSLEKNFSIQFGNLNTVPEYAGFVQSDEFAKWKKR